MVADNPNLPKPSKAKATSSSKCFVDQEAIEHDIRNVLLQLGLNPKEDPGLEDTPERVAKFLIEFVQPLNVKKLLGDGFENPTDISNSELIAQANIPFRMLCEHHLAPAFGKAAIGYIPGKKVVGLSKLTRLVQAVGTMRPSLQETICHKTADILQEHLEPQGVIVTIAAEHTCMSCRGVNTQGVITFTSSVRGALRNVPAAREEFFNLIKMGA